MSGALDKVNRKWLAPTLVSVGLILASGGCDRFRATADANGGQWYHASLATEEGDPFPFFLRLPDDCESQAATILNGEERVSAGCRRSPVGFVVDFPVYGTQIEAWFKPDGTLTGHWCREQPPGREPILSLTAQPVAGPDPSTRFPAEPAEAETELPHAEVAGSWRMEFDSYGVAKGVFVQKSSGVVTGSVEIPSEYGDLRFLAGNVRGTRVWLSTFDGQNAFMLEGEIKPDGTMEGEWVNHDSQDPFVAERDDDFEMPDPLDRVAFTPDEQRLELEPLRDSKFDGKGVIVQLFGTWCPNCNDHAPALVELYRDYRAQGLEILGLAYEYGNDLEYKQRRVREFKKKHGVE